MNTKLSFWLIPAAEEQTYFQDIINLLAQEYDAPTFTPHVTIYSGEYKLDDTLESFLEQAVLNIQSFNLKIDKLAYTEEFTKSLFIQFQQNSTLSQLSKILSSQAKTPSSFRLNPHLSLIYQYLTEETKKKLMANICLPKSEILFNQVRVISTPTEVKTRSDVENWQLICQKNLQFRANI